MTKSSFEMGEHGVGVGIDLRTEPRLEQSVQILDLSRCPRCERSPVLHPGPPFVHRGLIHHRSMTSRGVFEREQHRVI